MYDVSHVSLLKAYHCTLRYRYVSNIIGLDMQTLFVHNTRPSGDRRKFCGETRLIFPRLKIVGKSSY